MDTKLWKRISNEQRFEWINLKANWPLIDMNVFFIIAVMFSLAAVAIFIPYMDYTKAQIVELAEGFFTISKIFLYMFIGSIVFNIVVLFTRYSKKRKFKKEGVLRSGK